MTVQNQKKRVRQYVDKNPVEALRDIGTGVVESVKNDVVSASVDTLWRQFLGSQAKEEYPERLSGDLFPGTEIDLKNVEKVAHPEPVLPGIDYQREVRTVEVRVAREDQQQLTSRIAQILLELKKLAKGSAELQVIFREVTVEQAPAMPGKYHATFFEWLLNLIHQARLRVDESRSWLATFYQKRAKRQYWAMFKKHGTTFGLSSERVVATQTG